MVKKWKKGLSELDNVIARFHFSIPEECVLFDNRQVYWLSNHPPSTLPAHAQWLVDFVIVYSCGDSFAQIFWQIPFFSSIARAPYYQNV